MTAPAPAPAAASAQPPHHFIDPSNRVWDLDRPMLDWHCQGWEWTGTSSPATGPILHSISDPTRRESLIGLAEGAGLRQVPLDAPLDRDITLGVRYYGNSYPGGRYEAEVRTGAEEYEVWVRYTGAPAEGGAQ
jgi:hypothetical protein